MPLIRGTQRFVSVDICSDGLNRLRNADLVVKKCSGTAFFGNVSSNIAALENNSFHFLRAKYVVKSEKKRSATVPLNSWSKGKYHENLMSFEKPKMFVCQHKQENNCLVLL